VLALLRVTRSPRQCRRCYGRREPSSVSQAHGAFGEDAFGRRAEAAARFLGTPRYIAAQTLLVIVWIAVNAVAVSLRWDPYPFILLNLAFSTQAAYAAPLILLAQTRQADRDKLSEKADAIHREELSQREMTLLQQNTEITERVRQLSEEIDKLTRAIHANVTTGSGSGSGSGATPS